MPWDFYTTTTQIAGKNYTCDACEILQDMGCDKSDFKHDEWQLIKKAKADNFVILKGSEYIKTKGMFEGDFTVFRARPEIDKICFTYDMYYE